MLDVKSPACRPNQTPLQLQVACAVPRKLLEAFMAYMLYDLQLSPEELAMVYFTSSLHDQVQVGFAVTAGFGVLAG